MSELSQRAQALGESATMAISAEAARLKKAGEPVISYGAGEPDFATPENIVAAASRALADPRNHHYSAASGLAELKEAVAEKTMRDSGYPAEPSQVVITNGGKHAVYATFQMLLDPGDEVLLPSPYWVTYPEAARLAGGVPVEVPSGIAEGFKVTIDRLDAARTERTKLLVFVSPSNPTGAVYAPDEVRAIGEWAADNHVWVLTDEIYEHLVYGDAVFTSLPAVAPAAADRTVVVNGVAKTYAMTGWRVGWLIGPPAVATAAGKLQSHLTSNVNNVAQRAALAALEGGLDEVHRMREAFDRRRRTMVAMLREIDGLVVAEPEGAFYCFPDVTGLLDRSIAGRTASSSLELAALLLDEAQIAVVPGEGFGAPGYIRLSYALGDDELVEGLDRFRKLVNR